MGPAPKWCSFLDNLTEELESNPTSTVYDDYKFVTKSELETLGLANLVGTNVLRAYMHGYFMDIRLYKKAKLLNDPFNFEEFKNRKIKERLEAERENRVKVVRKLPVVNTELAKRIMEERDENLAKDRKKIKASTGIMEDKRFSELFTNKNFEINPDSEEFRLLNPVVQKNNEKRLKRKAVVVDSDDGDGDNDNGANSDVDSGKDESSSDDEHQWKAQIKEQYKKVS
jgi:ribosome biogenesis protein ENP2